MRIQCLLEYSAAAFFVARMLKLSPSVDPEAKVFLRVTFFALLFPCFLLYLAQWVLRKCFPARAITNWELSLVIGVCVVQMICSIYLGALGASAILVDLPRETAQIGSDIPMLSSYLAVISFLVAAIWNLVAAIVLWRVIRLVRRNYRERPWESFESA